MCIPYSKPYAAIVYNHSVLFYFLMIKLGLAVKHTTITKHLYELYA